MPAPFSKARRYSEHQRSLLLRCAVILFATTALQLFANTGLAQSEQTIPSMSQESSTNGSSDSNTEIVESTDVAPVLIGTDKFFRIDNLPITDVRTFKRDSNGLADGQTDYAFGFSGRGYYINDQRIEWTGQEETFGVEAVLTGRIRRQIGNWDTGLWAEFYLNQPFDRNILVDHPDRASFRSNFDIDTFEISQLFLTARQGDWLFALGKMATPFGRAYYSQYTNSREDGPFIRTESILWRETGAVAQYDPGIWVFTAGLFNGGDERDANSSKALIARVGIDTGNFVIGASIKAQDGIGSEHQKTFNNHVGLDAMFQRGIFRLSGEVIYDQYGFRKPGVSLQDIYWRRSLYYRQQNQGIDNPITGVGYYVNLDVTLERWTFSVNYGAFFPEQIGDPRHDENNRRGLVKIIRHTSRNTDFYLIGIVENELPVPAQTGTERIPWSIIGGFEFRL